ncbi:cellulase N-terminal Ig-like domain-containing protein [Streptomyces sp. NPDC056431]|uniref:cellulase N-terminal Ig-like domain-containing protein n=1 Tax=Streptomyces sp. NPDC056431 TaxID=3345814 RepID=UPI0036BE9378
MTSRFRRVHRSRPGRRHPDDHRVRGGPRRCRQRCCPRGAADFPVRVNHLGYLPDGPKRATLVSSATAPLAWQLRDLPVAQVASGTTTVRGADQTSGQSTHLVDFGARTGTGSAFTLVVSGQVSHPFDISDALYDGLRADSLSFCYQQRSGIAIEAGLTGSGRCALGVLQTLAATVRCAVRSARPRRCSAGTCCGRSSSRPRPRSR